MIEKFMEKFYKWVAFKLPKRLVKWAAMRVIAHATQDKWGSQVVPELTAMDAVSRWDLA